MVINNFSRTNIRPYPERDDCVQFSRASNIVDEYSLTRLKIYLDELTTISLLFTLKYDRNNTRYKRSKSFVYSSDSDADDVKSHGDLRSITFSKELILTIM